MNGRFVPTSKVATTRRAHRAITLFENNPSFAKGSLSEVQSQLYVALDLGYISQDQFRQAYAKADQVAKTMNSFIQAVKRTGRSGLKARKEHLSFREEVEKLLEE